MMTDPQPKIGRALRAWTLTRRVPILFDVNIILFSLNDFDNGHNS